MTRRSATLDLLERDPNLFDQILARMIEDEQSPFEVCKEMGFSFGALIAWCNADETKGRITKYLSSMEVRSLVLGEKTQKIADAVTDKDDVPAAKLQVETMFRRARAHNPKVFGEKQQVEHSGSVTSLMAVLSSLPRGNEIDVTPAATELEPIESGGSAPPIMVPRLPEPAPTPPEQEI